MKRYLIKIYGIVQGVGFRPFVYRIANEYHIKGFIKNEGSFVSIDCEGREAHLRQFLNRIKNQPPIQAKLEKIELQEIIPEEYQDFKIIDSQNSHQGPFFIAPDIAICQHCLTEISKKESKFYQYPFTTCTDCGPRFTVINDLPYDRNQTTMVDFPMCDDCRKEYLHINSRRFHAQSFACSNCGPKLSLLDSYGEVIPSINIIQEVAKNIKMGKIIAIKGIGGFHLCCDAKNDEVIKRLRMQKNRIRKPLAVMGKNMDIINKIAYVNSEEERLLTGKEKPIVLLNCKDNYLLSKYVTGNLNKVGVFLPYTPLHALLLEQLELVILTSGNYSGEYITYQNQKVVEELTDIVDYFLVHNRRIDHPVDDSVVRVVLNNRQMIRLGRGFVPMHRFIGHQKMMLACGVDEKAHYAFTKNGYAILYPYMGNLQSLSCYEHYKKSIGKSLDLYQIKPEYIIVDRNPHFLSSQFGHKLKGEIIQVYHHHAHMASCMGEFDLNEDVIGVIFDGTGLGCDGTIWGSEFLVGNRETFQRVGHLEEVIIQGNEIAIKEIWRIAYSYLNHFKINCKFEIDDWKKKMIDRAINLQFNTFKTTSMGRLFDGVSYLLGIIDDVSYDGEAAIELENIVDSNYHEAYNYEFEDNHQYFVVKIRKLFIELIDDLHNHVKKEIIATKFHRMIINMIIEGVELIAKHTGINVIVLSGGVFQNEFLLKNVYLKLKSKDYQVFFNQKIPINDNGIAYGQLIIGGAMKG